MGKLIKFILLIIVLLALAAGGGLFYLSSGKLNPVIKEAVETYGPEATGTPVTLNNVDMSRLIQGKVTLSGLLVDNPQGYTTPTAIELDNMVLHIDLPSLLGDVVTIKEFAIDGATITAEQTGRSSQTNLQALADNANRNSAASDTETEAAETEQTINKKFIVEQFRLTGINVDIVSQYLGNSSLPLEDVVEQNMGVEEGGLTQEELTEEIVGIITTRVNDAVSKKIEEMFSLKAAEGLGTKLKDTGGKIKDKFKSWFGSDDAAETE